MPVHSMAHDTTGTDFLTPYRKSIHDSLNEVIGFATNAFYKEKKGGSLGRLICEAMLWKCRDLMPQYYPMDDLQWKPTVVAMNPGGIRLKEIPEGGITTMKIYELLPFENTVTVIPCGNKLLQEFLDHTHARGGWPVLFDQKVKEDNIQARPEYFLVTNDYIAGGGDDCLFFKPVKNLNSGVLLRDVLIEYIKYKKRITPE